MAAPKGCTKARPVLSAEAGTVFADAFSGLFTELAEWSSRIVVCCLVLDEFTVSGWFGPLGVELSLEDCTADALSDSCLTETTGAEGFKASRPCLEA